MSCNERDVLVMKRYMLKMGTKPLEKSLKRNEQSSFVSQTVKKQITVTSEHFCRPVSDFLKEAEQCKLSHLDRN